MQSHDHDQQRRPPQPAQNSCSSVHKATVRHVMPGLCATVARTFRTPRKYYTTRAVVEDTKLPSDVVQTSLFHDIYDRLEFLEKRVEAQRETVREWRSDIAERRVA